MIIYPYSEKPQIETEGACFLTPAAVDRFIEALEASKKIVWPPEEEAEK